MEAILYIGISQCLLAGLLIAFRKPRLKANQILAAWLLLMGIEMAVFLVNTYLIELYQVKTLPYLYGPLLLLYTRWMTTREPHFNPGYLLHFTPFFIFLIAYLFFIDEQIMQGSKGFLVVDRFIPFRIVYALTFFVSITAYSIATYVCIHRYRKRLKKWVSFYTGKITLQWLLSLSLIFYLSYVLMFILGGIDILVGFLPFDPYEISFIGLTILSFTFSIFGFNQPGVFYELDRKKDVSDEELNSNSQEKYSRSGLKPAQIEDLLKHIRNHLNKRKPYLDRELTIYDLARQLGMSRHILSELINEHMGKNFYTLINEYRVEEVKRRLADPAYQHLTILAIALDAGFNAKSSFNTVFKEMTGTTPSAYQQKWQNKGSDSSD
ncbi:MAG: hypothetical protein CSA96_08380 [Bacteroidetes bacterium]|nr:MAG: hypothetical protein CSA96_08380 [Bacteroidota bacterium]